MTENTILKGLSEILDQDFVKTDPEVTARYSVDNVAPKAVIFPENAEQIAEVVKYANRENLAIVPWGSGTKMGMGNRPGRLDLVVCTKRLNHMKDVDSANLTITVEAGVKFRDIQARLATEEDRCYLPLGDLGTEEDGVICPDRSHSGCFLPIDPPFSNKATIGGIMATNSNGPRRLLYGLLRDIVLGVRFVSPDGKIIGAGGKTVKNVSGYDISKLMIGSMGSLGILCDMTLRLLPLPEKMETLLISFGSISEASSFTDRIFETKLLPAAFEVMNDLALKNIRTESKDDFRAEEVIVAVALEAFAEAVERMRKEMLDLAEDGGAKTCTVITEGDHLRFWLKVSELAQTTAGQYPGLITAQFNYPLSKWNDITRFSSETLSANSIHHTLMTHAGSGVCSINLLLEHDDVSSQQRAVEAVGKLFKNCLEAGGNMVIQEAPAGLKQNLPVWGAPSQDMIVMKRIKEQLDPCGVMSPGRYGGMSK